MSKREEKNVDRIDKALGVQQISAVILCCLKLVVYMSILNKLDQCHRWHASLFTMDDFTIDKLFFTPTWNNVTADIGDIVKTSVSRTGFNAFRTYWFFQAIYFAHGAGINLLVNSFRVLIVMFPAALLWAVKSIADIGLFHAVQGYYILTLDDFSMRPLLVASIANVVSGAFILIAVFYYNILIIFYGEHKMTKMKKFNCASRFFFFFPLIFVVYCIATPIVEWIALPHSELLTLFFYMVMISNGIMTIVILVGVLAPKWYTRIIFCAIGDEEDNRAERQKKMDNDEDIVLPRFYQTHMRGHKD